LTSGKVKYYNDGLDKVKPTAEKLIPQVLEDVVSSSTLLDPYLSKLIKQNNGKEKITTIYTTDKLLMAILTMKYSVYPWDLRVLKKGNQLVFDKADENRNKVPHYPPLQPNSSPTSKCKPSTKTTAETCLKTRRQCNPTAKKAPPHSAICICSQPKTVTPLPILIYLFVL
jgi:Eukaryotic translation initiation factor 3 subunit 7 (eIF-3)